MAELYNISAAEAVAILAEEQAAKRGITKAQAKKLVINALLYNVVAAEIDNQIDFILEAAQ